MLTKVISGGQTGSDIAGVLAAKNFGIETGGTMPRGFLTQAGPKPEYATLFNMVEHSSPKYPPRTIKNVSDSDGTIRLAYDFGSPGERLTLKAIQDMKKPYIDVHMASPKSPKEIVDWINRHNIKVLNVAGNSERTYSGITGDVLEYLESVFALLGFQKK
jgi:hypothetical protein